MNTAIICASGIGDALLFQTISHFLTQNGRASTTFSNHLSSFGSWIPSASIAPQPRLSELENLLSPFDAIFLQHDNSPKAFAIKKLSKPIYTFYGAHLPAKHGPLDPTYDYVCNRNLTMVENIALSSLKFFGQKAYGNALLAPSLLTHRKHKKRIAIHPTASSPNKIWPKEKFQTLFRRLEDKGFEPVFVVSPLEQPEWGGPLFPTLEKLASFLFESGAFLGNDSGTAHLASLLKIPHLVIGGDGLQMPLWRTGWLSGELLTAPPLLMRFKAARPHWKIFITTSKATNKLINSVLRN